MKLISTLALLSIASPILATPVPSSTSIFDFAACNRSPSCRQSYRRVVALWMQRSNAKEPKEPHFPPHQMTSEHKDILITPTSKPIVPADAITVHIPEDWRTGMDYTMPPSPSSDLQATPEFARGKGNEGATKGCHRGATVTYTYGYTYVKKDYADILVVGLVVVFLLAIVLIELYDSMVETARRLFGLPGAIWLETEDSLPSYADIAGEQHSVHHCQCSQGDEKM